MTAANSAELLNRLQNARSENLMVLYTDAFRTSGPPTDYDRPRQGTLGRRDAFSAELLRETSTRERILQEFEANVRWLANARRFESLEWLKTSFPQRHLPNAPTAALADLTDIIDRYLTGRRVEDAAVQTLATCLRTDAGEQNWRLVYGTALSRGFGNTTNWGLTQHLAWANGLTTYVRSLSELRSQRSVSRSGTLPGAPRTLDAVMVDAARSAWARLSQEQKAELRRDEPWRRAVRRLWEVVKERISWGILAAGGYRDADSLDNGGYRFPPRDLF